MDSTLTVVDNTLTTVGDIFTVVDNTLTTVGDMITVVDNTLTVVDNTLTKGLRGIQKGVKPT